MFARIRLKIRFRFYNSGCVLPRCYTSMLRRWRLQNAVLSNFSLAFTLNLKHPDHRHVSTIHRSPSLRTTAIVCPNPQNTDYYFRISNLFGVTDYLCHGPGKKDTKLPCGVVLFPHPFNLAIAAITHPRLLSLTTRNHHDSVIHGLYVSPKVVDQCQKADRFYQNCTPQDHRSL
jgi:hypothetical protein